MKKFYPLIIISIFLFNQAFLTKKKYRSNDNEEIWKKKIWTKEKKLWALSIVFFVLSSFSLFIHLSKNDKNLFFLYVGFFFLSVHMIGEWFFIRCDFEINREENSLNQYFIDNILGNLIIKPGKYELSCDPQKKIRKPTIIVNRNLSILFIFLYILSINTNITIFDKFFDYFK